MPETWGMLPKSQVDPEKIEEAIARMIKEHNEDETAHLGPGQSLQSHKASEIIDHLINSIVTDKLADKSVTPKKIYEDTWIIESNFESLDGWNTEVIGSESEVKISLGLCVLKVGGGVGNKARIWVSIPEQHIATYENPWFQVFAYVYPLAPQADFRFCIGIDDPFDFSAPTFGFKWVRANQKMYAFTFDGSNEWTSEIVGFDKDYWHLFRAEVYDEGFKIKFYIDGNLVATYEGTRIDIDSTCIFSAAVLQYNPVIPARGFIRNVKIYVPATIP